MLKEILDAAESVLHHASKIEEKYAEHWLLDAAKCARHIQDSIPIDVIEEYAKLTDQNNRMAGFIAYCAREFSCDILFDCHNGPHAAKCRRCIAIEYAKEFGIDTKEPKAETK